MAWKLYTLCRSQVLRAGIDGIVVGIDCKAVIEILKLYNQNTKEMFETIIYCWNIAMDEEGRTKALKAPKEALGKE